MRGAHVRVAYVWVRVDLPEARFALVQVAETLLLLKQHLMLY